MPEPSVAPDGKVEYGAVNPLAATAGEEIGWVSRLKSFGLVTSKPYFFRRIDGVSSFVVFVSPSEFSQTPRLSMKDTLTRQIVHRPRARRQELFAGNAADGRC